MTARWLGLEYRDLLPDLARCGRRVTLAVTRPGGRSYGAGPLRVVAVRESDERYHLILAYERYLPPYSRPKRKKGRPS